MCFFVYKIQLKLAFIHSHETKHVSVGVVYMCMGVCVCVCVCVCARARYVKRGTNEFVQTGGSAFIIRQDETKEHECHV